MDAVIQQHRDTMAQIHTELTSLQRKGEELEEEHKDLKEEVDEWKEVAGNYWLETPSQLETWMSASIHEDDEEYSKYMEPLELREENEKLKEEKKVLLQDWQDMTEEANKLDRENKELKEENKGLEEELLYYQMCVYSMDPRARYCSPAKEDVDGFTECPQQRKILYERIGYESDDDEDEQYMYDVRSEDRSITYYLGYDLDEARKHAGGRGLKILRYIVEDGEPNTDDWEIVE